MRKRVPHRERIVFRDYLRAHPEIRDTYAEHKLSLAKKFSGDRLEYSHSKNYFISNIIQGLTRKGYYKLTQQQKNKHMNFPLTKKEDVLNEQHGKNIVDPYRWLEDGEDAAVKEWSDAQNSYTNSELNKEMFEEFSDELQRNYFATTFSNPIPVKGRYFYTERKKGEDQPILYVKKGLDGTPIKLIDPNGRRSGNSISLDYWTLSKNGKYVAYGLSEGGNEMATLYVMDTETKENLPDIIPHCQYSSIQWTPDESAFFYTRNPRPGTVKKSEENMHKKVYFHKLGDDPMNDKLIFGEGRSKDDMLSLSSSQDGNYIGIHVYRNWTTNDIYLYNVANAQLTQLLPELHAESTLIFLSNKVLLVTNYLANNSRIFHASFDNILKPIDMWEVFVPEQKQPIEGVRSTKDKVLVEYLHDVVSEVLIFDHDGKRMEKLPIPPLAQIIGISTNRDDEEFFFGVDSFIFPKQLYYFDAEKKTYSLYRTTENPLDTKDYRVVQEWCTSKDGTRIPMFIVHKNDVLLEAKNPTILYGYGGFGTSLTAGFNRKLAPWLVRGGILVIANIRGGCEFGDEWHKAAIKDKKQNSFDDFIAAAEHLIESGYTDSEHIGLLGGSNGGLLVSVVATQKPTLAKAVCAQVPLTDMARFSLFGMASRWIHEYGDPSIKEEFINIMKWSPYHNIKQGMEYPTMLFTTGEQDSRVNPLHARKMTALLQSVNTKNPIFFYCEADAGHGQGKPISKIVESQAMLLSFFSQALGLKKK